MPKLKVDDISDYDEDQDYDMSPTALSLGPKGLNRNSSSSIYGSFVKPEVPKKGLM